MILMRGVQAMVDGLITIKSYFGPEETMNRYEATVRAKGMTVFAHIDHGAGAASAGLSLRLTDLIVFGNARAGTPLMQSVQTIGIDLPVKALVWQDESGATWLSYKCRKTSRSRIAAASSPKASPISIRPAGADGGACGSRIAPASAWP
jgi:uncharacterized protein (DUF302 family)